MRLIDADKVHTIIVDEMWDADDFPHNEQQAVLRACYSIMERIEKRAPIIEAIPVEWIKKYKNKQILVESICTIECLLADWGEENELAEPMPICNDENAIMPYETPKVNWKVDGMIPIEWIKSKKTEITHKEYDYVRGCQEGFNECIDMLIEDWEKENE